MFGSYEARRKAALAGKINLVPLQTTFAVALILSYLARALFDNMSDLAITRIINDFGLAHIPAVTRAANVCPTPGSCVFVMTTQWCLLPLYLGLLFVGYFPFSRTFRVGMDRSGRKRPSDNLAFLKLAAAVAFIVATILGDLSIIKFPTMFNGGLIVKDSGHIGMAALISSPLTLPFISWFAVVLTALIYWLPFVFAANYKTYMRAVAGD